ncbi:DUF2533 family protein [Peribacillus saganii]|uniref:DUF2533 family protein n=1 Tax=Peribacillus saganii TaxID=2303992 RepID=A0A372LE38_9BACI|nr:DUF2533 family protein [Peribacillus saganii]RFU64502.1 DUF2533 family protein [Peribacillus saganii]
MSVHKEITKHAYKQNQKMVEFASLDEEREKYIQEAIELCRAEKAFSTAKINEITLKMNALFQDARKMVTPEMVQDFVNKQ